MRRLEFALLIALLVFAAGCAAYWQHRAELDEAALRQATAGAPALMMLETSEHGLLHELGYDCGIDVEDGSVLCDATQQGPHYTLTPEQPTKAEEQ